MGINKRKFIKALCLFIFILSEFGALSSHVIYVMGPAIYRDGYLNSWHREGIRLYDLLKDAHNSVQFFPVREHVTCWACCTRRIPSKDFLTELYRRQSVEGLGYELADLIITTVEDSVHHKQGGWVMWKKVSIVTYGEGIRVVRKAIEIIRSWKRADVIGTMLRVLRVVEPSEEYLASADERDWSRVVSPRDLARRMLGSGGSSTSFSIGSTETCSSSDGEDDQSQGVGAIVADIQVAVADQQEEDEQGQASEESGNGSSSDNVDSQASAFDTNGLEDVFEEITVLSVPENYKNINGRHWLINIINTQECFVLGCTGCAMGCSFLCI